jgi:hypothetical protein
MGFRRGGRTRHKPRLIDPPRSDFDFYLAIPRCCHDAKRCSVIFCARPGRISINPLFIPRPMCARRFYADILRRPGCSHIHVLARHRRVRGATPTRLTDCRPLPLPVANCARINHYRPHQPLGDQACRTTGRLGAPAQSGPPRPSFRGILFDPALVSFSRPPSIFCGQLDSSLFRLPFPLPISVCSSSSASPVRASIGISSFTRILCNELSRGGLSRGGRTRHKTDVDPFVSLRISNVNI